MRLQDNIKIYDNFFDAFDDLFVRRKEEKRLTVKIDNDIFYIDIDFMKKYLQRLDNIDKMIILMKSLRLSKSNIVVLSKVLGMNLPKKVMRRIDIIKNYFIFLLYYRKYKEYLFKKVEQYYVIHSMNGKIKKKKRKNKRFFQFIEMIFEDPYKPMKDICEEMGISYRTGHVYFHVLKNFLVRNRDDRILNKLSYYFFLCANQVNRKKVLEEL